MLALMLAGVTSSAALSQDASFSYFRYEGSDPRFSAQIDGRRQYYNPVLAGYYPDPSLTRKGDTYYLVNSSFGFFPGVPIFESKDLVNWEQTGHVLDRPEQLNLQGHAASTDGIYAPAISYNPGNDTFYMITTLVGPHGGNFFVKSRNPREGWSDPVWLPEIDGIDPSFLFDDDGKAYIVHNAPVFGEPSYEGERAIRLFEFDTATDRIVSQPLEIVRGGTHVKKNPIWIEGPHLYHIGDYYYLMCAEGGTAEDHSEVIFRSRSPKGPWEEAPANPILTQRDLPAERENPVTCTGHADIIQTPEGEWWAVFLGCRPYSGNLYNTGRDTYLLPVEWQDGWPRILESGRGVPTVAGKEGLIPAQNTLTGNFSYEDRFEDAVLNPRWIYLRNAPATGVDLSDGRLHLTPGPGIADRDNPISAVFARQQHPNFTVETEVDFTPSSSGDLAGLALLQNEDHNFIFGKTLLEGEPAIVLKRNNWGETLVGSARIEFSGPMELKVEGEGGYYSFYYRQSGEEQWRPVAVGVDATNLSTAKAGGFIGAVIGPFATSRN